MKHRKKLCSTALVSTAVVLFLILVSSTASASITQTKITSSGNAISPAIHGNNVVWQDWRNGVTNIYLYNLSTKKETQITTSGSAYEPAIYGNKIVWCDSRNVDEDFYNWEVYVYDISTKKETKIYGQPDSQAYQSCFAIYGNKIVWDEGEGIKMYDLSTKKVTQISIYGREPDIYGNNIVWRDASNEGFDIYLYDLSTKKKTEITYTGSAYNPKIYGNKIVWLDSRNGWDNWDIYMYDIATKKETQLTTNLSNSKFPAIYGNNIVWTDDRNGNWCVYAYDLATRQQIYATEKYGQSPADIYDNKVVWADDYDDNSNIYVGTISYLPVAAFTASQTSGKAPLKVTFTEKSTDAYYWTWNFGDGTSSTEENPVHTYNKAGKYTVTLTVKNAAGSNTATASTYINVEANKKAPNADFSASATSGYAPLKVKFTDISTGSPTAWKWSLGDGSALVTQYNPTYTYTRPGIYTVKETVSNAAGKDTEIKTNYITVKAAPVKAPVAAFSATPTSGKKPLKVQFTDKSTNNPTSWKWSFGDGTYSTSKSPSHAYSKAGKYTVSLTAKNAAGSSTKTISGYIVVK